MQLWRLRVVTAHMASVVLGIVTGLLGLVIGPVMQSLMAPTHKALPWANVIGPTMDRWFGKYLPDGGLDPKLLIETLPFLLIGIASVKAVTTFYQWYTWEWLGEQLAKVWRSQVAFAFTSLRNESRDDGLLQAQEEQLGGVIAQDIRVLREFVVHFYGGLPREGLQALFTAVMLFALSPKLFGIFVICIAPVGALLSKFGRRIRKRASRALNDHSQLSEWIQQRLLGLETIKHYRAEESEAAAMITASESLFHRFKAAARLKSRTSPLIEVFGVIAMSIALWVAFHDIAAGVVSGAVVMSFFSSLALFSQSAAKLGRYLNSNQDGKAAGQRLLNILSTFEDHQDEHAAIPSLVVRKGNATSLSIENLSVGYGDAGPKVINDLSYKFKGGKIYCLVGKSGAGKSSLFNCILGLRRPSEGSLSATIDKSWHGAKLPLVSLPQTVAIVPTTLERNVSYPELIADSKRAEAALQKSQFKLSEQRLSEGLQTIVGPGFLQLSGGEAQRLQLARLYYHRSPFVLVDEGTSALDPVTEAEVLRSLKEVAREGACVIMIAHRRAAAEASDEVLLMEDGKIALAGTPWDVLSAPQAQMIFG